MPSNMTDTPRIYVACLTAYNNGKLHGRWIDATLDPDEIMEEVRAMLAESPEPGAEEWAIHDTEGFAGITIPESASFADVHELASNLEEHGEAFALYVEDGHEWDDVQGFEDAYAGTWDSEEAFAEGYYDGVWDIPEHLTYYIDWEKVARDLFIGDFWSERGPSGALHVFRRY